MTALSTDVAGLYTGYFDVTFADASGNTFTDSDPFTITVSSSAPTTPEPGTWLLVSTGLASAWLLRRRYLTGTEQAR